MCIHTEDHPTPRSNNDLCSTQAQTVASRLPWCKVVFCNIKSITSEDDVQGKQIALTVKGVLSQTVHEHYRQLQ